MSIRNCIKLTPWPDKRRLYTKCSGVAQAVLGVPVVLWVFFAKPVSLKTVRGAEDSAVANVPGDVILLAAGCCDALDIPVMELQA